MLKIGLFIPSINHFVETLVYWLLQNQDIQVILITSLENSQSLSEHPWTLKRLAVVPRLQIVSIETQPQKLDYLLFRCSKYSKFEFDTLKVWKKKAIKTVILSRSIISSWKECIKELCYSFPLFINASGVIVEASSSDISPYFHIQNRFYYTPFPHPQILWNEKLRQQIYSTIYGIDQKRLFKFHFIGNYNPLERKVVLEQVKQQLNQIPKINIVKKYPANTIIDNHTNALFIEYGDSGIRGVSSEMYIESLSQSDFCISPMGWGDNWTHRTVEALLRGAIPILEDPDRYNIGLKDMKNCIVVRKKNWGEAIERAYGLNAESLLKMRYDIQKIIEYHLLPERATRKLTEILSRGI